jgi:hypothetical protein
MKYLIALIIIIGFFACGETETSRELIEAENLTAEQIDSVLTEYKFQYESPILFDSSNHVLIPISTELLEKRTKYSHDGYYSDDYPRYWNVLFYNRASGETRLLTEDKYRISRIYAKESDYDDKGQIMENLVLYEIADIDYNKDSKLNDNDPEFLFSSNIDGTNLKRISPLNEDLISYRVIPKTQQILIKTRRDKNQDSLFNHKDESIWYKAELENLDWNVSEIIDSMGRKKIENLYFEQWLTRQ